MTPPPPVAFYNLGLALFRLDQLAGAEQALLRALELDPTLSPQASPMLAQIYLSMGDLQRLMELLDSYLATNPTGEDREWAERLRSQILSMSFPTLPRRDPETSNPSSHKTSPCVTSPSSRNGPRIHCVKTPVPPDQTETKRSSPPLTRSRRFWHAALLGMTVENIQAHSQEKARCTIGEKIGPLHTSPETGLAHRRVDRHASYLLAPVHILGQVEPADRAKSSTSSTKPVPHIEVRLESVPSENDLH